MYPRGLKGDMGDRSIGLSKNLRQDEPGQPLACSTPLVSPIGMVGELNGLADDWMALADAARIALPCRTAAHGFMRTLTTQPNGPPTVVS